MAARRANSRREIGKPLLPFMETPVRRMHASKARSEIIELDSQRQRCKLTFLQMEKTSEINRFLYHN
jgi:hypothetical protein